MLHVGEEPFIVSSYDLWDHRTSFYLIPVLSWRTKVLLTDHKGRHLTNHTTCWTLQGELRNKLRFRYPALLLSCWMRCLPWCECHRELELMIMIAAIAAIYFNVIAHHHVFNELEVCVHPQKLARSAPIITEDPINDSFSTLPVTIQNSHIPRHCI
jgi:hypothetical protein